MLLLHRRCDHRMIESCPTFPLSTFSIFKSLWLTALRFLHFTCFFWWSQGGKSVCIIKLYRVSGSDSTWIIQCYLNCLPPLLNGSAVRLNMQLSSADVTLVWHEAQNNGVYWRIQVSASHVYQKILFDWLSVMDMIMTVTFVSVLSNILCHYKWRILFTFC